MCLYGNYRLVEIINQKQNKKKVPVDACIADEIKDLNNNGVITLGCCCGHGKAGQITEYKNGFGVWRTNEYPPHVLINKQSYELAKKLEYRPYPYYYADGTCNEVLLMHLKSGCLTELDCKEWHQLNGIEYKANLGIIK